MRESSRRHVEIDNALGFHLRAASQFAQLSQQFQAHVRVCCDGRAANGRTILDLLTLAAKCGAGLEIEATGLDAKEAIAALCPSSRPGSTKIATGGMSDSIADSLVAAAVIRYKTLIRIRPRSTNDEL